MPTEATTEENLILERGIAAEFLLTNETFSTVLNTLMQQYLASLMATDAGQERERNAYYFATKAIQDIESTLNQWVAMKEQIANNLNAEDTLPFADEDNY